MHFAEFGVVMMLFLIGLEVRPSVLWSMRRSIFGLGGLQMVLTALLVGGISLFFGMNLLQGITVGLIFALSSTAIVLQTLAETGHDRDTLVVFTSEHGEMAGDHGILGKCVLYEESVKVPLLIRAPDCLGASSGQPCLV